MPAQSKTEIKRAAPAAATTETAAEKPSPKPPYDPGPIHIYRRVKWKGDASGRELLNWYATDFTKGEETSLEHLPYHQAKELITTAMHNPDQFEVV
jgi:hypothetical protein